MKMMENVVWHKQKVSKKDKENLLKQNPFVLWFTGLSGSGKSTIAMELEKHLWEKGKYAILLDGDNVRHGLCSDLGFSVADRQENLRRIRETAKLFYDNAAITIVSFISPFKQDRDLARDLIGKDFIEIYISCNIQTCEARDPKGLYKKARNGEIKDFTGIDQGYEEPKAPEISINSGSTPVEAAVGKIINYLETKKYI